MCDVATVTCDVVVVRMVEIGIIGGISNSGVGGSTGVVVVVIVVCVGIIGMWCGSYVVGAFIRYAVVVDAVRIGVNCWTVVVCGDIVGGVTVICMMVCRVDCIVMFMVSVVVAGLCCGCCCR